MNDLWKYSIANDTWTWVAGEQVIEPTPNYGEVGVPASTNSPPGLHYPTMWIDSSNIIYIFGGYAYKTRSKFSKKFLIYFHS